MDRLQQKVKELRDKKDGRRKIWRTKSVSVFLSFSAGKKKAASLPASPGVSYKNCFSRTGLRGIFKTGSLTDMSHSHINTL